MTATGKVRALVAVDEPIARTGLRRIGSAIMPVPVMSITWFEADGDYVTAHTERGRHLLTVALNRLEARLDPRRFVRIHRTHIVNLDAVVAFRKHGKGGNDGGAAWWYAASSQSGQGAGAAEAGGVGLPVRSLSRSYFAALGGAVSQAHTRTRRRRPGPRRSIVPQ
ncbi:MAG: LytTR family DNA-binding domain-containing protein [Gemmatimonadaceae bacterium]|nr:LytTR family DNA-binding domain-containing protein [Gemmatimonadaceae bacterium]